MYSPKIITDKTTDPEDVYTQKIKTNIDQLKTSINQAQKSGKQNIVSQLVVQLDGLENQLKLVDHQLNADIIVTQIETFKDTLAVRICDYLAASNFDYQVNITESPSVPFLKVFYKL